MKCRVLLFAQWADQAGTRVVEVDVDDGATASAVLDAVIARYPQLQPLRGGVAIAIDEAYAAPGDVVPEGATVALIPPVSGG